MLKIPSITKIPFYKKTVNIISDEGEAEVPDEVIIAGGSTSADFTIEAVDDALLDGTQTATTTASAMGYIDGSDAIDVTDHETLSVSIADASMSENGGTTTATVTRSNTDIADALIVDLESSDDPRRRRRGSLSSRWHRNLQRCAAG